MPLRFNCTSCGAQNVVRYLGRGEVAKCKECGANTKVPQDTRGKLISLATEADRTLYFDFLPINIGTINGFQAKFQLYTVPGQVYYNATRKLVLRGVDGLVFVADAQRDKMDENIESLANLEENLREYGYDPNQLPIVLQYNKTDLPNVFSKEEMNAQLNQIGRPVFEASATRGTGVFDTLKLVIRLVLDHAKSSGGAGNQQKAAAPAPPPPPEPEPAPYPSVERVPAEPATDAAPAAVAPPAPAPVSSPAAVAVGVEAGPVAPAPPPAAVPVAVEAAPESRPYPGSEAAARAMAERSSMASVRPMPDGELSADSLGRHICGGSAQEAASTESMGAPQMAPSLRRRNENKKRGFFKRLFGMR